MELLPKSVRRRLCNQVRSIVVFCLGDQAVLTLIAVVTASPSESGAERFLPVGHAMLSMGNVCLSAVQLFVFASKVQIEVVLTKEGLKSKL